MAGEEKRDLIPFLNGRCERNEEERGGERFWGGFGIWAIVLLLVVLTRYIRRLATATEKRRTEKGLAVVSLLQEFAQLTETKAARWCEGDNALDKIHRKRKRKRKRKAGRD